MLLKGDTGYLFFPSLTTPWFVQAVQIGSPKVPIPHAPYANAISRWDLHVHVLARCNHDKVFAFVFVYHASLATTRRPRILSQPSRALLVLSELINIMLRVGLWMPCHGTRGNSTMASEWRKQRVDGLVHDCGISSAPVMELPQSLTKRSSCLSKHFTSMLTVTRLFSSNPFSKSFRKIIFRNC